MSTRIFAFRLKICYKIKFLYIYSVYLNIYVIIIKKTIQKCEINALLRCFSYEKKKILNFLKSCIVGEF